MVSNNEGYSPSEAELKDYEEKGAGDEEKGKKEIEGNLASGQKILSEDREKLYNNGVKIKEVLRGPDGKTLSSIGLDINGKNVSLFFDERDGYSASLITKNGDKNKVTHLNPEVASKIFGKVEEQADRMGDYDLDNDLAEAVSDSILEELKDLEG